MEKLKVSPQRLDKKDNSDMPRMKHSKRMKTKLVRWKYIQHIHLVKFLCCMRQKMKRAFDIIPI